jgi:hypothetical protein
MGQTQVDRRSDHRRDRAGTADGMPRRRLIYPQWLWAFALSALAMTACGGGSTLRPLGHADPYLADWSSPARSFTGRPVTINRHVRTVVIQVDDGTCVIGRGKLPDPRRRLDHVRVLSRQDAVFIAVWMRQERPLTHQACFGVGQSFRLRVRLLTPLGRRALVMPDTGCIVLAAQPPSGGPATRTSTHCGRRSGPAAVPLPTLRELF